jgi:hypothetical protein
MRTEGFRHIMVVQETRNRWKGMGKFVPLHSMKTYKRSRIIAPPIHKPDTRLKLQVMGPNMAVHSKNNWRKTPKRNAIQIQVPEQKKTRKPLDLRHPRCVSTN